MEWLENPYDEEAMKLQSWERVCSRCHLVTNATTPECGSCWDPEALDLYERGVRG